jgi:hypothetical protein
MLRRGLLRTWFCAQKAWDKPSRSPGRALAAGAALLTCSVGVWGLSHTPSLLLHADSSSADRLLNWAGTKSCVPRRVVYPESLAELEAAVQEANRENVRLRAIGSALSPNGIGFCDGEEQESLVNVALMDKVLSVDREKMQVTVQAGIRIDRLAEELAAHGLTLENYASIKEQQLGGFIQIGAHGTGLESAPVDEHVLKMTLVTPSKGTLRLSKDDADGARAFYSSRVGCGALGVLADVTLQCVPAHSLVETHEVMTIAELKARHRSLLAGRLRYVCVCVCVLILFCLLSSMCRIYAFVCLQTTSTSSTTTTRTPAKWSWLRPTPPQTSPPTPRP